MKPRITIVYVLSRDCAAMRFNDRTDNYQPHSQPLRFCGEKLLEYALARFPEMPIP
jgi:hypothetical protein